MNSAVKLLPLNFGIQIITYQMCKRVLIDYTLNISNEQLGNHCLRVRLDSD